MKQQAVGEAKLQAGKAAASPWTRRLVRWGLVSKGALYLLVGAIAVDVAVGGGDRVRDRGGALAALADTPQGKVLVGLLGVGLLGYALWRFIEAVLGRSLEGGKHDNAWKRLGYVARGFWYIALFGVAAAALAGADESGGSGREDRFTGRMMDWPLGRWLVAAVGVAILGAAAYNLWRGVTSSFRKNLKLREMSKLEDKTFSVVGAVGHLARGIVFGLIGFFLVRAAWNYRPKEAIGLDGALAEVLRQDYGDTLLALVAAGLLAYGLYCFVEAKYREV